MPAPFDGTLLATGNLADKIDVGRYYLAARKSYDQYYLETVGIPCGKSSRFTTAELISYG